MTRMMFALDEFGRFFPIFLAGVIVGTILSNPKIQPRQLVLNVTNAGVAALTASTIWLLAAMVVR